MIFDLAFIVRFFMAALAIYRLAWMFTKENGLFGIFAHIRAKLGARAAVEPREGIVWTIAELFNCPHCFGVWLAILFLPAILFPSQPVDAILIILAVAGLQSFMTGRSDE